MPPELIWQEEARDRFEIAEEVINGIPVQIMITGDKRARVERIISTDPRHFLESTCQPGQETVYREQKGREQKYRTDPENPLP